MISLAYLIFNAVKKERELTRKNLVAYSLERNYECRNLGVISFERQSIPISSAYYYWMRDLLTYARASSKNSIKSRVEQHQVLSKLEAKGLVCELFSIMDKEGNWGRMAVLMIFIEELADGLMKYHDRTVATSFIEEIKEEINDKALGDWGEKLLIDSECFMLY